MGLLSIHRIGLVFESKNLSVQQQLDRFHYCWYQVLVLTVLLYQSHPTELIQILWADFRYGVLPGNFEFETG